jgi:translocator protein
MKNKSYFSLLLWVVALILIGSIIGSLTKPEISTWYGTLNRAPLTPPNEVFPIAWTILYGAIGACGWFIWRTQAFPPLKVIKTLYVTQIILNWSWTPLFFGYHLTGL